MDSIAADPARYNTFWLRLCSLFLDIGALAPLQWIDKLIWNSTAAPLALLSWSLFQNIMFLIISVGMVALYGQTPGKMACGVKIVGLTENSPVSLKQAALREFLLVSTVLITLFIQAANIFNGQLKNRAMGSQQFQLGFFSAVMLWYILEFITMLSNKRRRAIHDFIAGTVVVREPATKKKWLPWLLIAFLIYDVVSRIYSSKPS